MDLRAISYTVGGKSFMGYAADGSTGRGVPGILVAHEGGGLTDHTKERASMLAELGYVALAMARRAPERVRGLLLAGSRATPDPPDRKALRDEMIRVVQEEGIEGVAHPVAVAHLGNGG